MRTVSYTVVEQDIVQERLNLDNAPVGLNITIIEDDDSCSVSTVPPRTGVENYGSSRELSTDALNVSKKTLRELWEQGAIEKK